MIKLFLLSTLLLFAVTINPICEVCHKIVNSIQKNVPERPFDIVLDQIAIQYCQQKHIQSRLVCKGAVTQMMHSIINSAWRHLTDPHAVCHNLRFCPKQYLKRNLTQQIANIMKGKPNKEWENPTGRKSLKVLHISDLHPDLYYTVGAETNCSEPVCCRSNVTLNIPVNQMISRVVNGQVSIEQKKKNLIFEQTLQGGAGYWGSIAPCDLPFHTFDLFISSIKKLNVDFIIWTGDNTPHDIWQQSQSYNLNFTRILGQRLKQALNIPIIPAMGNHESYPVNVYDFEGDRQTTLNAGLAEIWRSWIGEQAYHMLTTKGYYSTILSKFNNLKIININTQAGNNQNWFLIRNPTDPGQMLKWIQAQLKQSQSNNQFVYLIGHIPPNNNLNDWAVRYNVIIDRYSYIVRGQFFGHTHNDHLAFHHGALQKQKIVNYYLVAPSLTTYDYRIPRYRVVDVDYDTLEITDFHQYILDLRKYTKKEDNAQFSLLYSFKSAYGLSNMSIKDGLLQFQKKLKSDIETQKKYDHYFNGGLKPGQNGSWHYCQAFATPAECAACKGDVTKKSQFQKFAGDWRDLKHNSSS